MGQDRREQHSSIVLFPDKVTHTVQHAMSIALVDFDKVGLPVPARARTGPAT